jgi:ABC-type sulfate/molybdate transport systems ATPase subunit
MACHIKPMVYFSSMAFLSVEGLTKQDRGIHSVRDISFILEPFQRMAIAGETGSGKSSLLKMVAGLKQPDAGSIYFEGKRVLGPEEKLMPGHPGIGYLSQHFELRNNYVVEDELDAKNKLTPAAADHIFTICRIQHLLKRKTNQISGGEKQRIALARVLITSPRLILLDEPFSNLDMAHKKIIKEVVRDISEELGITSLMVLHDAHDILSWADIILVIQDGQIIQRGSPEEIYHHPINEYCAGLFGEYNLVDPSIGFIPLHANVPTNKKLFFRPEDVQIANETAENAIKGIICDIRYWGSFYTLEISVGNEMISMQVRKPGLIPGDLVYLTLSEDSVWYL